MTQITKEAAFETSQAIWEYDPSDPESRVLGNSLDVIAALRTLATKIQVSGQRIQEFHKIQREFKIDPPLSLILHGNTRWGSAFGMVDRGLKLAKVCNALVLSFVSLILPPRQSTGSLTWPMRFSDPLVSSESKGKLSKKFHGLLSDQLLMIGLV